ncbi:MAG: alpha/beta fold hydrolase [Candidatus Aquilonibacter sp.]
MKRRLHAALVLAFVWSGVPVLAADFREEPVSVPISVGTLSGTLMFPPGNGPFPVALIIAGSGPTDRNGNNAMGVTGNTYMKLAQGLAAEGIATLRYDKRFIGSSPVKQTESELRFDDFVSDALTLTRYLEGDARFNKIAIIGHSEGSLIGIVAAERDSHIRALVSLEGAGRNLAAIIEEQISASPGVSVDVVNEVKSINASLLAGKTVAIASPTPLLMALFRPSVQPYIISEYEYDPAKELAKLKIPVLIIHGTTDLQVSATDAKLLAAADPRATVVTIDGMNHILVDAPADPAANAAAYTQPALPLSAKLVPTIAQFLKP